MNEKFSALLGFAAKSGNLSYGMDSTVASVKAKKAKLVVVCSDVSEKSRKEISFQCENMGVRVIFPDDFNMEAAFGAVGRSCGILAVNDSSFADGIIKALR